MRPPQNFKGTNFLFGSRSSRCHKIHIDKKKIKNDISFNPFVTVETQKSPFPCSFSRFSKISIF